MNADIFISYRRADSKEQADRLFNDLKIEFGIDQVFMDTSSIDLGDKWPEKLETALKSARMVLVVIGPGWLKATDKQGIRRIDNESDWVRLELTKSLQYNHAIVPVLVNDADLPADSDLPACMQGLSGWNGLTLHNDCWKQSLEPLIAQIRKEINAKWKQELQNKLSPRYDIKMQLGQRNSALVYKAKDLVLDRYVAIKVFLDDYHSDKFDESLMEAVRVSDETSFFTIYDACLREDLRYYVMQFVNGPTLRKRIEQSGRGLPVDLIRKIMMNIGEALLQGLCQQNTVGNIKPSNIVLSQDDQPFISPMNRQGNLSGRSLLEELKKKEQYLDAQTLSEELAYLLPEQFDEQLEAVSVERSTQYLLGLIAYELITGELPPTLSNLRDLELNGKHAFHPLPPLTQKRPNCPERIEKIIQKMTSIEPAERYEKLEDALTAIRHVDPSLSIAKDSYQRCTRSQEDDKFFKTFYLEFIRLCPKAEGYFQKFGDQEWQRQYKMLKQAILLLFAFIEQGDWEEPNILSRIAESHAQMMIPVKFYKPFADALINTVCGNPLQGIFPVDPRCKEEGNRKVIETAWRNALKPGIEYMIEYANQTY